MLEFPFKFDREFLRLDLERLFMDNLVEGDRCYSASYLAFFSANSWAFFSFFSCSVALFAWFFFNFSMKTALSPFLPARAFLRLFSTTTLFSPRAPIFCGWSSSIFSKLIPSDCSAACSYFFLKSSFSLSAIIFVIPVAIGKARKSNCDLMTSSFCSLTLKLCD